MSRFHIGDPWVGAHLLRAEEMFAEARAFTARRALLRDARPPRRLARVWLGSVLLVIGHRLLGSVPRPATPAYNLPPGAGTTRLESTTNFFAVGRAGLVRVEATPLHGGESGPGPAASHTIQTHGSLP